MKQIVELDYILTPEDTQRHIEIPFKLDAEYEKIHFQFSYSPKWVEEERAVMLIQDHLQSVIPENQMGVWDNPELYLPLENLITLSLDYNHQYVGAHHCKDATQHIVVSEGASTKGFVKHPVREGDWRAKMSLHCVQSEYVYLNMKISVE